MNITNIYIYIYIYYSYKSVYNNDISYMIMQVYSKIIQVSKLKAYVLGKNNGGGGVTWALN